MEPARNAWTPELVVRDYGQRVFHLARRMLSNDADAEDVTQEVLLQVVRKLGSFRGEARIGTWLHRVTVNAALALRRKKAARAEHEIADPNCRLQEGPHCHAVKPFDADAASDLEHRETAEWVQRTIQELPEVYRDVFVLSDLEGLSNAEIGRLLEISLPAVKSRLHRARQLMREALQRGLPRTLLPDSVAARLESVLSDLSK